MRFDKHTWIQNVKKVSAPRQNNHHYLRIRRVTMAHSEISRRRMMRMGFGAATTAGLVSLTGGLTKAQITDAMNADSQTSFSSINDKGFAALERFAASFQAAYAFLDTMMDAYAQESTLRLVQS